MAESLVFLGLPQYGRWLDIGTAVNGISCATRPDEFEFEVEPLHISSGGFTCCDLWCKALNARKRGVTHFAMIHTDVDPEPFWLSKLWQVMKLTGAELVFATVSLKDDTETLACGVKQFLTSGGGVDPEMAIRRLPIAEVKKLPEHFTALDVDPTGRSVLCMSTGLWLADIRRDWADECTWICKGGKEKMPNGEWAPWFASEDYIESTMLGMRGVKVVATQSIHVGHWAWGMVSNWSKEKRKARGLK